MLKVVRSQGKKKRKKNLNYNMEIFCKHTKSLLKYSWKAQMNGNNHPCLKLSYFYAFPYLEELLIYELPTRAHREFGC